MSRQREKDIANYPFFVSWFSYFVEMVSKRVRPVLTNSFMTMSKWRFNFTRIAGGRGPRTVQSARFDIDQEGRQVLVLERGYPPMKWSIVQNRHEAMFSPVVETFTTALMPPPLWNRDRVVSSTRQLVRIADFPPHDVFWNKERWEWEIKNVNVVFWSIADDEDGETSSEMYIPADCM